MHLKRLARPLILVAALLIAVNTLSIRVFSLQTDRHSDAQRQPAAFHAIGRPFLQTYFDGCHGGAQPAAGFDLTSYTTQESIVGDQRRWNLVLARLKASEMPPRQARQQPTAEQRRSIVEWIETVGAEDAKRHPNDPGIVLARRLSNAEYDYTVHDLTGV